VRGRVLSQRRISGYSRVGDWGPCLSHDDNRRHLGKKFQEKQRFTNFGPILEQITISGFRGVASLELELRSPVTALSGLNGTGKSTIAQLAACAYRPLGSDFGPRNYVRDYFPVSALDPQPFSDEARVVYDYAAATQATQQVTVSRASKEWSGYKRQPERLTHYVGLTSFLPKIEKRDFSVYGGARVELGASHPVQEQTRLALQKVLGLSYQEADFTRVILGKQAADLARVLRSGQRYSENHMGFGEGRMFYLVNLLESTPERSLFVIEEPETSLHGDAQSRLAEYFVEVADRRRHQIIVTTHSSAILDRLARESVVYLRREPGGAVSATTGLSTYQVDSYLHVHHKNDATICVEDDFAQALVTEVLRAADPDLLAGISFLTVGSHDNLRKTVPILRSAGLRALAVTDSDCDDAGENYVMSMPGTVAPEKEVFDDEDVRMFFGAEPYRLDTEPHTASQPDHHRWVGTIANALALPDAVITTEACRVFVATRPEGYFDALVHFIRSTLADHS